MPAPRRTAIRVPVALAALALATLAGCSSGSGDPGSDSSASPSSAGSASTPEATSASPSPTDASATDATPSEAAESGGPALGSRTFTVESTYTRVPITMRFDLVELKRRGELLDVVGHLVNTSTDRTQDMRWQVAGRFLGIYREDLTTTNGTFSGVLLTDVADKKRYLVAADSGNRCVCTDNLSATFVGAGQTVELTATYAAPPSATTELDVSVPQLGVFRDVPVT